MPEIVFISGCSSGIGLATARLLAHDPLKRFLVYATILKPLSEEKDFQEAAGSALNETLFPLQMDVTKDHMIKSAISGVMQKHNRIDILSKLPQLLVISFKYDFLPYIFHNAFYRFCYVKSREPLA